MPITAISRDWGSSPSIVRITTTDDFTAITTAGYLSSQAATILDINKGVFEWLVSDVISISYEDGQGFFTRDATTDTFVAEVDIPAGSITTAMIANGAVTYPKIQNVTATDRLLGRSTAGAGVVEEIVATAQARALLDDATQLAQAQTILNNVGVTAATVAGTDKILGLDVDDSGALKSFTAQSIADLAGGGADTALSNLAAVAINTALLSAADNTLDFGAFGNRWADVYGTRYQTGHTIGNSYTLSGWDVDGAVSVDFFTVTAGNTPTAVISGSVTGTTQAPATNNTTLATTAYADAAARAATPSGITAAPPIYTFASDATQGAEIRLMEDTDGGVNYFALRAPAAMSANLTMIAPTTFTSGTNFFVVNGSTGQASTTNFSTSVVSSFNALDAAIVSNSGGVFALTSGFFLHPLNVPAANYYYSPIGARGINTASAGISAANDIIYIVPMYIPPNVNKVALGIETADAGGTADVQLNFYTMSGSASFFQAGSRLGTTVTISDIATTGVKTATFTGTVPLGGWYWLAIRSDNITTALTFAAPAAVDDSQSYLYFGVGTDYTTPAPIYGYQYNAQTSMPSDLSSVVPSAVLTTPIGVCMYV